ncbi:hypothetical protein MBLNU13_g11692t1 [Cladosporium sp. NU13]
MRQSNEPQFRLNLGDMDLRARLTSSTAPQDSPVMEDFRAAAVKRYQGYLHDSISCGFRPVLARTAYRSLNIANGNQSQPSPRMKRLLNALPRLNTGWPSLQICCPQRHEDAVPDYFSLFGGWERYVQLPCCAAVKGHFDWHSFMREDAQRILHAMDRCAAITAHHNVPLANEEPAARAAREARRVQFYNSLMRECYSLEQLVIWLVANEPFSVRLVPMYDEWRYRMAEGAIAAARDERRWREEWAMKFADARFFVLHLA